MPAPADDRPDPPKRRYNSSRRTLQAAQTRDDVLAAAVRLFSANGWAGTTITAVAAAAGVSVETVYSGFGSKKGLLRAAMEVAVVGDAAPIPFVEREEFAALGQGERAQRMRAGLAVLADIHERSAGVWRAITEASAADAEVDAWRLELERGRRVDTRRSIVAITGTEPDEALVDLLWALFGPEIYLKLTSDAGRSRREYEASIGAAFTRLLPVPADPPAPGR